MEPRNNTIQITVGTFGILKEFIKDKAMILEAGSSLSDLFNFMIKKYGKGFREFIMDPETNQISPAICILLNRETVNNLNRRLTDGDEVTLFILVSGG